MHNVYAIEINQNIIFGDEYDSNEASKGVKKV